MKRRGSAVFLCKKEAQNDEIPAIYKIIDTSSAALPLSGSSVMQRKIHIDRRRKIWKDRIEKC